MKYNLYKTSILFLLITFLIYSCKDNDDVSSSTPVIGEASFSPASFNYGDSVTLTVNVSDQNIKLSTLEAKITIGNELIDSISIRTKGNLLQVSKKIFIPFKANSVDGGELKAILQLININGDVSKTVTVNGGIAKNPVTTDNLYMFLKYYQNDKFVSDTVTLSKKEKFLYASPKRNYTNGFYVKVANNKDLEKATYVWEKNESLLDIGDGSGDFLYYSDALFLSVDTLYFNASTFQISYGGVNLANITDMNITLHQVDTTLAVSDTVLVQGKKITFHGVDNTILKKNINQDYFEYISDNVYKFKGLTGFYTIKLKTNAVVQYMELAPKGKSYPEALCICGEGIGAPNGYVATSWWGWDENQYFYCMKTGIKQFQFTCYLRPNSTAEPSNFKVFASNGWSDVSDYSSASEISDNLTVADDRNIHLKEGEQGGIYVFIFDFSNSNITKNKIIASRIK